MDDVASSSSAAERLQSSTAAPQHQLMRTRKPFTVPKKMPHNIARPLYSLIKERHNCSQAINVFHYSIIVCTVDIQMTSFRNAANRWADERVGEKVDGRVSG